MKGLKLVLPLVGLFVLIKKCLAACNSLSVK